MLANFFCFSTVGVIPNLPEIMYRGGGGGVLPYISYIGMCHPIRVLAPFWSGIRYGF